LIEAQHRGAGAIEEIARVERIVAEILKDAAVVGVASALGDNADLAAGSGAEFRRVVVRLLELWLAFRSKVAEPGYSQIKTR
jgi:hypothetical protein